MEFQYLRQFKVIAELEHMTRASEKLHVAQPALSKIIRILEDELKVKLFDRVGKNIKLNQNGHILLKYTNEIMCALDDVKKEMSDVNEQQDNRVVILMYAASKLLPKILLDIKKQYPEYKFIIKQHESEKEINADLFIYSTKEKVHESNVVTLLEEEILLAVPNDHAFASKQNIRLEEAASESFISLQTGKDLRDITTSYCRMAGFEPEIILESDDPATVRGFIGVGLGIAFLPAITWGGGVDNSIKLLSIANIPCNRYINLSFKKGRYQSRATKVVSQHIVEFFKSLQKDDV